MTKETKPPKKRARKVPEEKVYFIRMKNSLEDLVAYVREETETQKVVVRRPLRVEVETIFEDNRQIMMMFEYLPQSVVAIDEVELDKSDIQFITPVRAEFQDQYDYVSKFFYERKSVLKSVIPTDGDASKEQASDVAQKVVSILEAMNKKDKPIH
jgi:hypothetical protein